MGEYLASDWTEQVEEKKGPEAARAREDFARALPNTYRDLREMHAAGVEFLAGSDAAVVFMYPGFSLHGELDSLVHHVGLTGVTTVFRPARSSRSSPRTRSTIRARRIAWRPSRCRTASCS